MPIVACPQCGSEVRQYPNRKRQPKFCDAVCAGRFRSANYTGTKSPHFKGVELPCEQCGKVLVLSRFRLKGRRRNYCNRTCRAEWLKIHSCGSANPSYRGGSVKVTCTICGKIVHRLRKHAVTVKNPCCSRSCLYQWRAIHNVGPANCRYVNGYTSKTRSEEQALMHKLRLRMASRMRYSLSVGKNGHSWEALVGYTVKALKARLNATMPAGYTWKDFMAGKLHIDHKIPVSVFHFTTPTDPDFARCWALRNLQLLPAGENIAKGASLSAPFQPSLL
jgi:hypothetical protein